MTTLDRRNFLSMTGKGLGLAAVASSTVGSLLTKIHAATKTVAHLTPAQAAGWRAEAESFASQLREKTVPKDILDLALRERDAYRKAKH